MSRPKKTEAQRRAEFFEKRCKVGKAETGLLDPQIAAALGIGASTFRKYKKDPGKFFSTEQIKTIGSLLGWSTEDHIKFLYAEK